MKKRKLDILFYVCGARVNTVDRDILPVRPKQLIDNMIEQLVKNGFDSVLTVKRESKSVWCEKNGRIERIDKGDIPRKYKKMCFLMRPKGTLKFMVMIKLRQ